MKIAGIIEESLKHYPGAVAFVVFTQGCNFKCRYCFNPEMARFYDPNDTNTGQEEEIFQFLENNINKYDAVVVSGGEPTLHKGLPEFLGKFKKLGLIVRLETNGTNPGMLRELISLGLVDYIALDVKAPLDKAKYKEITGVSIQTKVLGAINQSIRLLTRSEIDYEVRTTLIKEKHSFHDILDICNTIVGCKRYCLQEFDSEIVFDKTYNNYSSYHPKELERLIKAINPDIKEVNIK